MFFNLFYKRKYPIENAFIEQTNFKFQIKIVALVRNLFVFDENDFFFHNKILHKKTQTKFQH